MQSLDELKVEIRGEFPDFKLTPKSESHLMRAVGGLLYALSFGRSRSFMQRYITTVGHTVYTNLGWDGMDDVAKIVVLRHERVHMRQQKRLSFPVYAFLYLLVVLPAFLAIGRTKLEQEAYTETIRAQLQYRGTGYVWSRDFQDWLASQFVGPAYLWMWPFPGYVMEWVKQTVESCVEEYMGYRKK